MTRPNKQVDGQQAAIISEAGTPGIGLRLWVVSWAGKAATEFYASASQRLMHVSVTQESCENVDSESVSLK